MSREATERRSVSTRNDTLGCGSPVWMESAPAWLGKATLYLVAAGLAAFTAMAEQLPATVFSLRQGPSSIVLSRSD